MPAACPLQYNHNRHPGERTHGAPWDTCATEAWGGSQFAGYVRCKEATRSLLQKYDAGSYDDFLQHLLAVVPRRNVLVLNYADALGTPGSTRSTLRQITRHYGGPILDRTTSFPHTNTKVGAPACPPPFPRPPPHPL